MQISFAGGAWIRASSYGLLTSDRPQKLPEIEKLFSRVPARFGRFDDFTRLGFAVVALALHEAGWTESTRWENTGLIIASECGVLSTDLHYYATTTDQDGLLSSPNLFSYTLPVTVIGECAVFFRLTGPTFCIGDDRSCGLKALEIARFLLEGKQAQRMIAAWIEIPPSELPDFQKKQVAAAALVLEPITENVADEMERMTSLFSLFPSLCD